MNTLPHIKKENGVFTLYVDGEPYVALGGEVHNSSSSSLQYMREKVWPNLRGLNLNTVIVPVFWELIEPVEDSFDFGLVDGIIEQAREEKVRLVFLWFGLWKNGESNYVPGWVKKDYKRYFRACYQGNIASNTISPLCDAAVKADAKAFRKLMKHLKDIDGHRNTVIMMQVENEIGFLRSERDFSEYANTEFEKHIPAEVETAFDKRGKWSEAFGEDAGEYFMAYHYACAVEQIAKAGTEEYGLPMFVNAWLEQFPERPGSYPSGGPIAKVMDMWKLGAPTICLYAPDIYLPSFKEVCEEYTAKDNPLFIPEARRDVVSASNVFYAIGKHNALCFSPFGIEDFLAYPSGDRNDTDNGELLSALNIEVSGFTNNGTGPYLAKSYELLGNMMGIIIKYRGTGKMTGFLQSSDKGSIIPLSEYDLKLTYLPEAPGKPSAGGIVIEVSDNEFILAGIGFTAEFLPKRGEKSKVGYIRIEEGAFINNNWVRGRVLNGDEGNMISVGRNPEIICIEMYKYGVRHLGKNVIR
jgi:hypothetical protein